MQQVVKLGGVIRKELERAKERNSSYELVSFVERIQD